MGGRGYHRKKLLPPSDVIFVGDEAGRVSPPGVNASRLEKRKLELRQKLLGTQERGGRTDQKSDE